MATTELVQNRCFIMEDIIIIIIVVGTAALPGVGLGVRSGCRVGRLLAGGDRTLGHQNHSSRSLALSLQMDLTACG